MSIFQGVMEEELERNLRKQDAFRVELAKHSKGYLSICHIVGCDYVYRKHRDDKRIVSVYIGPAGSEKANDAQKEREAYLLARRSLKDLKEEEKRLRKAIKDYAKL